MRQNLYLIVSKFLGRFSAYAHWTLIYRQKVYFCNAADFAHVNTETSFFQ